MWSTRVPGLIGIAGALPVLAHCLCLLCWWLLAGELALANLLTARSASQVFCAAVPPSGHLAARMLGSPGCTRKCSHMHECYDFYLPAGHFVGWYCCCDETRVACVWTCRWPLYGHVSWRALVLVQMFSVFVCAHLLQDVYSWVHTSVMSRTWFLQSGTLMFDAVAVLPL